MKRFLIPLGIFVAVAVLLAMGLRPGANPSEVPSPLVNKPAPALGGLRLFESGKRLTLADLRGEVALVNVWASWCVACRDEHPYISALADQGVPVYGLNYKDERDAAKDWLARYGNPYTASVFDDDGAIGLDWGVYGVPETFVLDAEGTIRYKHIGAITEQAMEQEILPRVRRLREAAES